MEFNIGERVRVKSNGKKGRMAGATGTIEDSMWSNKTNGFLYQISFDDFVRSQKLYSSEELELCDENVTYCHEFEYLENVVVARFYEIRNEVKTEIGRGHGHIIHKGAIGIAQASSYALKKIFENMNGGSLT
jgi:hypothetical protein